MSKAVLLCLCLLASCARFHVEPIVVEKPTVVKPPANLVAQCPSGPSDGTISGELQRLSDLVRCEWAKDAALQTWVDRR